MRFKAILEESTRRKVQLKKDAKIIIDSGETDPMKRYSWMKSYFPNGVITGYVTSKVSSNGITNNIGTVMVNFAKFDSDGKELKVSGHQAQFKESDLKDL